MRTGRTRCARRPPATAPARKAPSADRLAAMENPGAPAAANPMRTTLPVMLAVKTCPSPRKLTASTKPLTTVRAARVTTRGGGGRSIICIPPSPRRRWSRLRQGNGAARRRGRPFTRREGAHATGAGPPGHDAEPRRGLPVHRGGGARATRGRDRRRPARRLVRLRPLRALRRRSGEQPEHGRLRSDRAGQERLRQVIPVAPGRVRPPGLGRRSQGGVRRSGRRLGCSSRGAAAGGCHPAQPARPRSRRRR